MSKVYNVKSNCVRGARSALKNPAAQPGVDFQVVTVPGGFTWSVSGAATAPADAAPDAPLPDPPAATVPTKAKRTRAPRKATAAKPRKPRKVGTERPSVLGQKQAIRAMELCAREKGCTVGQGAADMGVCRDTFRGLISRINTALEKLGRPRITKGRPFKEQTYFGSATAAHRAVSAHAHAHAEAAHAA